MFDVGAVQSNASRCDAKDRATTGTDQ